MQVIKVCLAVVAVAVVGACVPPADTAASQPAMPSIGPTTFPILIERMKEPKRFVRHSNLSVTVPVAGVTVRAEPEGSVGWTITFVNDTDEQALVAWDESSFVGGNGHSWGRLIPTNVRTIGVDLPRPPMPVPPHSTATETVVSANMGSAYEIGLNLSSDIDGGRLVLSVQTGRGKATWQANVKESASEEPTVAVAAVGFSCSLSVRLPGVSFCTNDVPLCEYSRRDLLSRVPDLAPCAPAEHAWCFRAPIGLRCFATTTACEAQRANAGDASGVCEQR